MKVSFVAGGVDLVFEQEPVLIEAGFRGERCGLAVKKCGITQLDGGEINGLVSVATSPARLLPLKTNQHDIIKTTLKLIVVNFLSMAATSQN